MLATADVACFLLRLRDDDEGEVRRAVRTLAPIVRDRGGAFLIDGRVNLARDVDADGAHVAAADGAVARQELGPDRSLGIECGLSRHLAMEAADLGADYVAMGSYGADPAPAILEMVTWWAPLFVVPCVAWATSVEEAAFLAKAGSDFVAVCDPVWAHERGAIAGLEAIAAALG